MSFFHCNCNCTSNNSDNKRCSVFNCTKEELIKSGLYISKFMNNIVCCSCGWESGKTKMTIRHLNLIHSVQSPDCPMVQHIPKLFNGFIENYTSWAEIEDVLRESFLLWPKAYIDVEDLVKSGFFYTGDEDAVTCFSCKVTLEDWQADDIPDEEHKKASPNCKLFIFSLRLSISNKDICFYLYLLCSFF